MAVEHQRRTHRRHRHLAWLDVVGWRRPYAERIGRSRRRKVVHFVVENYSGSFSTDFRSEAVNQPASDL